MSDATSHPTSVFFSPVSATGYLAYHRVIIRVTGYNA
jgi:hypothetical protein